MQSKEDFLEIFQSVYGESKTAGRLLALLMTTSEQCSEEVRVAFLQVALDINEEELSQAVDLIESYLPGTTCHLGS